MLGIKDGCLGAGPESMAAFSQGAESEDDGIHRLMCGCLLALLTVHGVKTAYYGAFDTVRFGKGSQSGRPGFAEALIDCPG